MSKHNYPEKYAKGVQVRLDKYQQSEQLEKYFNLLEYVVKQIKP